MTMSGALSLAIVEGVESLFPELSVTISLAQNPFLIIHPEWDGFGQIRVSEADGELVAEWGHFTHSHFGPSNSEASGDIDSIVSHFTALHQTLFTMGWCFGEATTAQAVSTTPITDLERHFGSLIGLAFFGRAKDTMPDRRWFVCPVSSRLLVGGRPSTEC